MPYKEAKSLGKLMRWAPVTIVDLIDSSRLFIYHLAIVDFCDFSILFYKSPGNQYDRLTAVGALVLREALLFLV